MRENSWKAVASEDNTLRGRKKNDEDDNSNNNNMTLYIIKHP